MRELSSAANLRTVSASEMSYVAAVMAVFAMSSVALVLADGGGDGFGSPPSPGADGGGGGGGETGAVGGRPGAGRSRSNVAFGDGGAGAGDAAVTDGLLFSRTFLTNGSLPSSLARIGNTMRRDDAGAGDDADDENGLACEFAYHKCLNRDGCKTVLGYYIEACEDLQGGWTTQCSVQCRRALIGLTSTEEGKLFMQCRCSEERCRVLKERILACRPAVESALRDPQGLSCLDAEMVCEADAPCGRALQYYRHRCRKMFHGIKCNPNCLNSLRILRRQEKAAPLATCRCDGTESYDCAGVRTNSERLCFPTAVSSSTAAAPVQPSPPAVVVVGEEDGDGDGGGGGGGETDGRENGIEDDDYEDDGGGGGATAGKKVQFPYSVNSSSPPSASWTSLVTALAAVLVCV